MKHVPNTSMVAKVMRYFIDADSFSLLTSDNLTVLLSKFL